MRRSRKNERGVALLLVLLLVASLSAIAVGLTGTMDRAVRRTLAVQTREQATWALIGAERAALNLLSQQERLRPGVDTPQERWLAAPIILPFEGATLTAAFADRSGCFNLNTLAGGGRAASGPAAAGASGSSPTNGNEDDEEEDPERDRERAAAAAAAPKPPLSGPFETDTAAVARFGQLVANLGGAQNAGEALGAAVADFMDSDGDAAPAGAEDSVYDRRGVPHRTGGVPFASPSEVRAVNGWTAPLTAALSPWLCVVPNSLDPVPFNVNTASPALAPLASASLSGRVPVATFDRLFSDPPPDGYGSAEEFLSQPTFVRLDPPLAPEERRLFETASSLIEFSARLRYDGMEFEMTSLIERSGSAYRVVARRFGGEE